MGAHCICWVCGVQSSEVQTRWGEDIGEGIRAGGVLPLECGGVSETWSMSSKKIRCREGVSELSSSSSLYGDGGYWKWMCILGHMDSALL